MSWLRQTIKLVGTGVLACSALACVEQEASLGLQGVAAFTGTSSSTDVSCSDQAGGGGMMNDMGRSISVPSRTCERQTQGGEVENFRTRVSINIPQFKEVGQPGEGKGLVTNDEFCAAKENGMLPQAVHREFFYSSFNQWVSVVNRLDDSTTVEATGQGGGGGGGFEGLQQDVNDIQIKQFRMRFPEVPETGSGQLGLDQNQRLYFLVESEGDRGILEFSFFNQSQADQLAALHRGLVLQRNGNLNDYNAQAKRTPVTVIAEISLRGQTIGEQEVESNRVEFPIELCNDRDGCGSTTPRCNFQTEGGG